MHSLSLAKKGYSVDVVGYCDSKPLQEVSAQELITIHAMNEPPDCLRRVHRIIAWPIRVLWQTLSLFFTLLFWVSGPEVMIVQNPPSVPTLPISWLVCRLKGSKLIIDWHNYGFTILSMTTEPNSFAVKIYRWFEGTFGAKGDGHLCVTKALMRDLNARFGVHARVLYDRPGEHFRSITIQEKHDLFLKLGEEYPLFLNENGTIFTQNTHNGLLMKEDRPAVIISSTSWTEDENFGILLEALRNYDDKASESHPNLLCIITGRGPLKDFYQRIIQDLNLKKVQFALPWLESGDYPRVLASGDVGVSLHTSSSNLDLPMKVLDMFGCCLPVCAFKFDCLHELVVHGENGLHFTSGLELSKQLLRLLSSFPRRSKELLKYREKIRETFQNNRWHDNWCKNAWPVLQ